MNDVRKNFLMLHFLNISKHCEMLFEASREKKLHSMVINVKENANHSWDLRSSLSGLLYF